ncbi:conserved Plasmodium protein, unknown function [Plasmodium sp. gorilla clade G2]|uniref:conserved Plasmodium protein, unknown function n=1 Tax=Plasmodium sp. gorilla clade G2 TaxID=880535 RepID=UPI000D223671|nr:conserved Plasmodium protein, unknown function [Plasmodium sp. gorilla clade G2]SOV11235.1 conserved Plasmodium protein, unknown function [Plasmodium sp. gorilla clade G2]
MSFIRPELKSVDFPPPDINSKGSILKNKPMESLNNIRDVESIKKLSYMSSGVNNNQQYENGMYFDERKREYIPNNENISSIYENNNVENNVNMNGNVNVIGSSVFRPTDGIHTIEEKKNSYGNNIFDYNNMMQYNLNNNMIPYNLNNNMIPYNLNNNMMPYNMNNNMMPYNLNNNMIPYNMNSNIMEYNMNNNIMEYNMNNNMINNDRHFSQMNVDKNLYPVNNVPNDEVSYGYVDPLENLFNTNKFKIKKIKDTNSISNDYNNKKNLTNILPFEKIVEQCDINNVLSNKFVQDLYNHQNVYDENNVVMKGFKGEYMDGSPSVPFLSDGKSVVYNKMKENDEHFEEDNYAHDKAYMTSRYSSDKRNTIKPNKLDIDDKQKNDGNENNMVDKDDDNYQGNEHINMNNINSKNNIDRVRNRSHSKNMIPSDMTTNNIPMQDIRNSHYKNENENKNKKINDNMNDNINNDDDLNAVENNQGDKDNNLFEVYDYNKNKKVVYYSVKNHYDPYKEMCKKEKDSYSIYDNKIYENDIYDYLLHQYEQNYEHMFDQRNSNSSNITNDRKDIFYNRMNLLYGDNHMGDNNYKKDMIRNSYHNNNNNNNNINGDVNTFNSKDGISRCRVETLNQNSIHANNENEYNNIPRYTNYKKETELYDKILYDYKLNQHKYPSYFPRNINDKSCDNVNDKNRNSNSSILYKRNTKICNLYNDELLDIYKYTTDIYTPKPKLFVYSIKDNLNTNNQDQKNDIKTEKQKDTKNNLYDKENTNNDLLCNTYSLKINKEFKKIFKKLKYKNTVVISNIGKNCGSSTFSNYIINDNEINKFTNEISTEENCIYAYITRNQNKINYLYLDYEKVTTLQATYCNEKKELQNNINKFITLSFYFSNIVILHISKENCLDMFYVLASYYDIIKNIRENLRKRRKKYEQLESGKQEGDQFDLKNMKKALSPKENNKSKDNQKNKENKENKENLKNKENKENLKNKENQKSKDHQKGKDHHKSKDHQKSKDHHKNKDHNKSNDNLDSDKNEEDIETVEEPLDINDNQTNTNLSSDVSEDDSSNTDSEDSSKDNFDENNFSLPYFIFVLRDVNKEELFQMNLQNECLFKEEDMNGNINVNINVNANENMNNPLNDCMFYNQHGNNNINNNNNNNNNSSSGNNYHYGYDNYSYDSLARQYLDSLINMINDDVTQKKVQCMLKLLTRKNIFMLPSLYTNNNEYIINKEYMKELSRIKKELYIQGKAIDNMYKNNGTYIYKYISMLLYTTNNNIFYTPKQLQKKIENFECKMLYNVLIDNFLLHIRKKIEKKLPMKPNMFLTLINDLKIEFILTFEKFAIGNIKIKKKYKNQLYSDMDVIILKAYKENIAFSCFNFYNIIDQKIKALKIYENINNFKYENFSQLQIDLEHINDGEIDNLIYNEILGIKKEEIYAHFINVYYDNEKDTSEMLYNTDPADNKQKKLYALPPKKKSFIGVNHKTNDNNKYDTSDTLSDTDNNKKYEYQKGKKITSTYLGTDNNNINNNNNNNYINNNVNNYGNPLLYGNSMKKNKNKYEGKFVKYEDTIHQDKDSDDNSFKELEQNNEKKSLRINKYNNDSYRRKSTNEMYVNADDTYYYQTKTKIPSNNNINNNNNNYNNNNNNNNNINRSISSSKKSYHKFKSDLGLIYARKKKVHKYNYVPKKYNSVDYANENNEYIHKNSVLYENLNSSELFPEEGVDIYTDDDDDNADDEYNQEEKNNAYQQNNNYLSSNSRLNSKNDKKGYHSKSKISRNMSNSAMEMVNLKENDDDEDEENEEDDVNKIAFIKKKISSNLSNVKDKLTFQEKNNYENKKSSRRNSRKKTRMSCLPKKKSSK